MPHAHSHRKKEAWTSRDQPQPLHNKGARKFKILDSNHSQGQPSVSSRSQSHRIEAKGSKTKMPHVSQTVSKSRSEVGIAIIDKS
jgi:hypothetical protein